MYNNPSVSAVNTPTLTGNPMQQQFQDIHGQQYHATPDSSTPGTPAELDDNIIDGMDDMSMQNNPFYLNQSQNFNYGAFGNNDMLDLCIDEPAKRLFSTTGGFNPQSQSQSQSQGHMRLGSGQYGPNSDLARRIREQQMLAGLPDTTTGLMPHDEPKPFRCPVIGCEKAYKNQNGLKYHKSVGHMIIPRINPLTNKRCSTVTITSNYMITQMAHSQSSTRRLLRPIQGPWAWKKRNHTNAKFAVNVTRT